MGEMRILTVRQPWAHAIMHGGKRVENRVRNLAGDYRGPVAIHAGAKYDRSADEHPEIRALARRCGVESMSDYLIADGQRAYRRIIGVVDLVGVHYNGTSSERWDPINQRNTTCSPWAEHGDVYHLELANPRPLAEPIPYTGALGLRRLDNETTAAVWSQTGL